MEARDNLGLPRRCNIPITRKRRQHLLVTQIWRPGFKLLRRLAQALAQLNEGFPKTVRVEIWQPRCCECLPKNLAHRICGGPRPPVESVRRNSSAAELQFGRREQGISRSEQQHVLEVKDVL